MILEDELIGLQVKVKKSTDRAREGLEGKVVDETKNTLVIETPKGDKTVPKGECSFSFHYKGKWTLVDGRLLVARPEDRIKRARHLSRKWRLPKFFFRR